MHRYLLAKGASHVFNSMYLTLTTRTLEGCGEDCPYPMCRVVLWRLQGPCNGQRCLWPLLGRLLLLGHASGGYLHAERDAAEDVVERWLAPAWDWVATGRATRWASNSARTSLRMRCRKAVKSVWAGSGAGGSGGCTVVIGTTCPRGAVVSFLAAARVVRRAVVVALVLALVLFPRGIVRLCSWHWIACDGASSSQSSSYGAQ